MTKSPMSNDRATEEPQSAAILLLLTVADTTWRMFLPTVGGAIVGIILDNTYGTVAKWTVALIAAGIAITTLLIILQFRKLKR
ncbi:MAG: hypothetical protein WA087_00765 [Candidatus Saccharimonadales bacterium]